MTKYNFIRQFATVLLGSLLCAQAYSQNTTDFLFSETAPDYVRSTMQNNTKVLFKEINSAYDHNKAALTLSASNLTQSAIKRIQSLWATSHFYCTETGITTRVLKSQGGYQVRNIPVFMKEGKTDDDQFQDVVIEFTLDGKISDLYIAIAPHQYAKIMSASNEVTDIRHRQMILDLVENFRTAYNTKDMQYLDNIYSDDALIITGKVLKPLKRGDAPTALNKQKIEYSVQNKKQYLRNLSRVFASNSYINIKFDNIVVTQHEGNPNIYGVTLKQNWNSSNYRDEGWLFLLIDYSDESNPLIWVRTWQPLEDSSGNPVHYSTEDIFGFKDFGI